MGKKNKNKNNNAKAMAEQLFGYAFEKARNKGGGKKNKGGGGGGGGGAPAARPPAPAPAARAATPVNNPNRGGGGGGGGNKGSGRGGNRNSGGGGWSVGGGNSGGGGGPAVDPRQERNKQAGRATAGRRGSDPGVRDTLFGLAIEKKNNKKGKKKSKNRDKRRQNDSPELTYFTNDTTPVNPPAEEQRGDEPLPTFDYAAQMEAMLAPLRAQIEALTNNVSKKTQEAAKTTITGSSDSGLSGKTPYTYTPASPASSNVQLDTKAGLFDSWMNSQESLNRASTAYLFAPGGTRRDDEAATAGSSASTPASSGTVGEGGTENMRFWNQTDSDLTQAALDDTQYDEEERRRRAGYFGNGERVAGSIFGV